MYFHQRFPFPVEFTSQQILDKKRELEAKMTELNRNKFDWDTMIKYNMQV